MWRGGGGEGCVRREKTGEWVRIGVKGWKGSDRGEMFEGGQKVECGK